MKKYQLSATEVVLYKSEVSLLLDDEKVCEQTELLLTNENFVFINKTKNSSQENLVEPIVVPIESIKVYNEMPYILKKEQTIEIYSINGEYFLEFKNKKQANEFFNKSMRVASGYSKFVRGVKKVSKELKETNKALNITETTKKAIDFAADVTIDYAEKPKHGKLQILSSVAKVFKKRNKQNSQQIDAQPEKEKLPPHPTQEENN